MFFPQALPLGVGFVRALGEGRSGFGVERFVDGAMIAWSAGARSGIYVRVGVA